MERHTKSVMITGRLLTVNIFTAFFLLIFTACNSTRRSAHKYDDLVLNRGIDTLNVEVTKLSIKDSSITPWLDTILAQTKKLPEYDNRIPVTYLIRFKQNRDTTYLEFESNNFTRDPDIEAEFKDEPKLWGQDFEVLPYKGHNFCIVKYGDQGNLKSQKERLFNSSNNKILVHQYQMRKRTNKHQIDDLKYHWTLRITCIYINKKIIYVKCLYFPVGKFISY